jgi:lysophospholipase L1-like esterase
VRRRPTIPSVPRPIAPSILLLCSLLLLGCASTATEGPAGSPEALPTGLVGPVAPTAGPGALRYVALGDSYTYGDGVQQADRWPNQLARILRPDLDIEVAANLSGRSTATQQLISDQLPKLVELRPQFVSVQVGFIDAIFDTPPDSYAANMAVILDTVLGLVPADRAVVITTPDFTLIPANRIQYEGTPIRARIQRFNQLLRDAASERGIAVVDISAISERVPDDPTLVASDGKHPSGKQYAGWADLIAERVRQLFATTPGSDDASPSPSPAGSRKVPASPAGGSGGSVSP